MITALEADEAAVACVVVAHRTLHFSIATHEGNNPRPAVIEAWKVKQPIFVHVTTTLSPAEPRTLTHNEKQEFRRQAAKARGQAWEARVLLSPDLELVGLEWRPLEEDAAGE